MFENPGLFELPHAYRLIKFWKGYIHLTFTQKVFSGFVRRNFKGIRERLCVLGWVFGFSTLDALVRGMHNLINYLVFCNYIYILSEREGDRSDGLQSRCSLGVWLHLRLSGLLPSSLVVGKIQLGSCGSEVSAFLLTVSWGPLSASRDPCSSLSGDLLTSTLTTWELASSKPAGESLQSAKTGLWNIT